MSDVCDLHSVLPVERINNLVRTWLAEDTPNFDYGGLIVGKKQERAQLLIKSPGVLAGVPFFNAVFKELNCEVEWLYAEGSQFNPKSKERVAVVSGACCNILLGERVALNCLCRASGIATLTRKYLKKVKDVGWKGNIAGTRKTTPGFRLVEKYALLVAGADTHRYNLSSMVMLKDNHVWSSGSIKKAVKQVKSIAGFSIKVEVECGNLEQGLEAANAGADVIMFDNFSSKDIHSAAASLKSSHPHVIIEASGGIDETSVTSFCGDNIDLISTSKLVQGYPAVDFSLKILRES